MMHWTFGFLVFILFSWGINQQNPELTESKQRGELIYDDFCVTCHRANGKGFGESIRAVKYGLSGEITVNDKTYNKKMEPLGLSDKEVADVMNFILNSWGNTSEKMVTVEEVEKKVKN